MSEFSERHTAARLIGAPAGYVGYEEGGQLTDKIRRQPYSVLLLDEIEKAHPEVFNMLLQILEDGRLSDAKSRAVDFSNTIVILTSNLGAERMQKEASFGFQATSKKDLDVLAGMHKENTTAARDALEGMMRPELINRFDKIVVFNALTKREAGKILNLQIAELKDRLFRQGLSLTVESSAKRILLASGYDARNGARPMRRVLQEELEHIIADGLLRSKFIKGNVLTASVKQGVITVTAETE